MRTGRPSALALASIGLIGGVLPFFGVLSAVAVAIAVRDVRRRPRPRRWRDHRLSFLTIAVGAVGTTTALIWTLVFIEPPRGVAHGSGPHGYSHDGTAFQLETELLTGSLYPWAERRDIGRLTKLQPIDGQYRLQITDDRDETGFVDSLGLMVVDHPSDVAIVPTERGEITSIRDAAGPLRATGGAGADVLDLASAADGRALTGAAARAENGEPRVSWRFEFARPPGDGATLLVVARSTQFAEDAFGRYMATMGQGMSPFMEWVANEDCPCSDEVMDEELDRLGLPLWITISPGEATATTRTTRPIGPAAWRRVAIPIKLPETGARVSIRIEATPGFWEVDQIELARSDGEAVAPTILKPSWARVSSATQADPGDVLDVITRSDRRRLAIPKGQHLEARFAAPPSAPGLTRSTFAVMRGHYRVAVGGRRLINPLTLLAHRWGLTSLPRFAAARRP